MSRKAKVYYVDTSTVYYLVDEINHFIIVTPILPRDTNMVSRATNHERKETLFYQPQIKSFALRIMNTVPKETIARILQLDAFEQDSTQITEETLTMLQGYVEILVREAVLRSVANKEELKTEAVDVEGGNDNHTKNNETILTHEDLEKIIGLLLLDM